MTLVWKSGFILQSPAANDPLLDLNTQPSLDLQFATSKTLNDRVSGQNLITFSRSTTGTYVDSNGIIQTAAIDAPRFDHDPTTGESLGLLIEESRTNEFPYSEDFTNSSWTNVNTSVTLNAATAPDNTLTANRLQIGATNGVIYNNTVGGVTSNSTISVWVKAVSPGTNDVFRLVSAGALSADITATSQWVRYNFTSTSQLSSLHGIVRPADNTAADVYVWGAQFEENKTFPTSYIPTSGSTVTRAADLASITGTNFSSWYNQSEGTMFIRDKVNPSASYSMAWVLQNTTNLNDGSVSNYLYTPSGSWILDSRNTGVNFDLSQSNVPGTFVKRAAGLKNGDLALALNGSISTSQTGTITASTSLLYIGQRPPFYFYNGHIARLTYYPYRLPDATLQEITS